MKASKQIASRMRDMLTQDKVGVKQGFSTALENDVNNMLRDYFALDGRAKIKVEQSEKGEYKIAIEAVATRVKQFQTTLDMPRY